MGIVRGSTYVSCAMRYGSIRSILASARRCGGESIGKVRRYPFGGIDRLVDVPEYRRGEARRCLGRYNTLPEAFDRRNDRVAEQVVDSFKDQLGAAVATRRPDPGDQVRGGREVHHRAAAVAVAQPQRAPPRGAQV